MPNWLRHKGIVKAARTRAFEKVCTERGISPTPEEALSSPDLAVVAAGAWLAPMKVLQEISDKEFTGLASSDRLDLILMIHPARSCWSSCGARKCRSCERVLDLYQDLGLEVPEHLA